MFQEFFEIITDKKYRSDFYENELMQLITNEIKRFYQQLSNKYITEELGINIININANNTEKNNSSINTVDKEKRYNILKSFLLKLYDLINKEEVYYFSKL